MSYRLKWYGMIAMLRDALEFWNPWWGGDTKSLGNLVNRPSVDEVRPWFARKEILAITGVRRSGKSSLMKLLIRECLATIPAKQVLYVNLDDLALQEATIQQIIEEHERLMVPTGKRYILLDEVQRKPGWERWLKRYYDGAPDMKFVVSGSNSSLLMTEYSTYLTGREMSFVLHPLDFREFVLLHGIVPDSEIALVANRLRLQHLLEDYIRHGGFPEVVLEQDEASKVGLLKGYMSAIIAHDVLARSQVREKGKLERLATFLATNVSNEVSTKSLGKTLELNPSTVQEYLDHFEEAYLFFQVNHFSYSLKAQYTYPRKVYCVDTGLRNAVSFRFSEDLGRLMENVVFLRLAREGDVYYWREGTTEVDFVVQHGLDVTQLVQSCHDPSDPKVRKREETALLRAMRRFKIGTGTIVTWNEEGEEKVGGKVIEYRPLWRWLLEGGGGQGPRRGARGRDIPGKARGR
jgi:predicted AAA+ superfamily ATPase